MTSPNRNDTDDFAAVFLNDISLFDLRAPIEFNQGAFPCASTLPLMTDDERAKVGICYKRHGQDAAVKMGNRLVSGEIRKQRMDAWQDFIANNPDGYLYCFRGGLRSKTVQGWLADEGIDYPLIKGGYKAMRRFLIDTLEELSEVFNFVVIGGRTGTLKTDLILFLENSIDLEGRANHRGSSFGRRVGGQPTVINFENSIAIDLLKLKAKFSTVFIEDEGVTIGRCSVPEPLRNQIKSSPIYLIEATVDERVENILRDYVLGLSQEYIAEDPMQGWANYKAAMLLSLERIKKRLGGECHNRLYQLMDKALNTTKDADDFHRDWIKVLLIEYYDPMYDFQLKKKQPRIIERGSWNEIKAMTQSVK